MYKQVIIARKDLNMSPGKLAAQVSHASMAFLATILRESEIAETDCDYLCLEAWIPQGIYNDWLYGSFTKVVLEAKNKTQLLKAIEMAEELGLKENVDFFVIRDACRTELEPEEDGCTITCIGFRPMEEEEIDAIGKKYQLYH